MQVDFVQALRDIGREKDIPLETLREIIEAALVSAYKKHYGATCEIHVEIDWEDLPVPAALKKGTISLNQSSPAMQSASRKASISPRAFSAPMFRQIEAPCDSVSLMIRTSGEETN